MDLISIYGNRPVLFDGAMGTMIQKKGLDDNRLPEVYNITHPEVIGLIHRAYIEAGSDIITTNTFGANPQKLSTTGISVEAVISAAVKIAKKVAGTARVALDIGPTGQLMAPYGDLTFETAYEIFTRQVKAGQEAGADLILIETMSDLYEAKAAVLAAKQETNLPVICTMTFQKGGKTLMGTDPLTLVTVLEGLGVDGLGLNCSLGPADALPLVEQLISNSHVPILVQANAGLPQSGESHEYDCSPAEFSEMAARFAQLGVEMLGGCCGTTPVYIKEIKDKVQGISPEKRNIPKLTAAASSRKTVVFDRFIAIGQNINPSGRKDLTEAIKADNIDALYDEAELQDRAGADLLDINVATGLVDEKHIMQKAIEYLQSMLHIPLQIDSADSSVLEAGARIYNGKPLLNSVNGSEGSMESIFPIAKKYGASVIAMTIDEKGIPETAQERLEIAKRIVEAAESYGIEKHNIIIDCVVQSLAYSPAAHTEAFKALSLVKSIGVKTTLGVGNLSFGLKDRDELDAVFLAMNLGHGLDSAIMKVTSKEAQMVLRAFKYLQETSRILSE